MLPAGALGTVTLRGGADELLLASVAPEASTTLMAKVEPGHPTVTVRSCWPSAPATGAGAVDAPWFKVAPETATGLEPLGVESAALLKMVQGSALSAGGIGAGVEGGRSVVTVDS